MTKVCKLISWDLLFLLTSTSFKILDGGNKFFTAKDEMKASVFKVLSLTETIGVEKVWCSVEQPSELYTVAATAYGIWQGLAHIFEGSWSVHNVGIVVFFIKIFIFQMFFFIMNNMKF